MAEQTGQMNPFQWYVGKLAHLDGRSYTVEAFEIHERNLVFRLVSGGSSDVRYLSLFELLALEARSAIVGAC